jgi:hypothetical protein
MTHGKRAAGARTLVLALLVALFLVPEPSASAIPKDPTPSPTAEATKPGSGRVLLARRRRRRHYPKRRRHRPKPKPKPAAPEPAPPTPTRDTSAAQPEPSVDPGSLRRGGRVEFDGRLVQGQTAKSGAIYLFARKRSELRSMVQERVDYRKEVLRTVYPSWESKKGSPVGRAGGSGQ